MNDVVRVHNTLQIQNRLPSGKPPNPAHAQDKKDGPPEKYSGQPADPKNLILQTQGVNVIQGNVVRIEGDTYFVKEGDGKEISLHADTTTMKTHEIKTGDRVEVKIDRNNHALPLLPAP